MDRFEGKMKPADRQMAGSFTSGRRRAYFTILGLGKPNSNIVNEKIRLRDGRTAVFLHGLLAYNYCQFFERSWKYGRR